MDQFLQTAEDAARGAGSLIMSHYLDRHQIENKTGFDFVTEMDRMSETYIRNAISSRFPDHHFFCEEQVSGSEKSEDVWLQELSGYTWVVDALDGTTNFILTKMSAEGADYEAALQTAKELGYAEADIVPCRFNGIPVSRYVLISFIISGAVAGLGGGAELLGTQFRLINGFGAGYGFDGVAMALIASLHPLAGILVAIFFAALRVGSTTMQTATGVPTSVSDIIQALVIVFTVAGMAMVKLPEFRNRFLRKAGMEA